MQTQVWLSALKYYFIVVGITYIATKVTKIEAACHYAVALMGGNAARWMDRIEV